MWKCALLLLAVTAFAQENPKIRSPKGCKTIIRTYSSWDETRFSFLDDEPLSRLTKSLKQCARSLDSIEKHKADATIKNIEIAQHIKAEEKIGKLIDELYSRIASLKEANRVLAENQFSAVTAGDKTFATESEFVDFYNKQMAAKPLFVPVFSQPQMSEPIIIEVRQPPTHPLHCTSMSVGLSVDTDCY